MKKQDTLNLAARHLASGKKVIMACRRELPVGYVIKRWSAPDNERVSEDEIIDDQHVIVVRASSFEEYVENVPADFGPVLGRPKPGKYWFYEVTCE